MLSSESGTRYSCMPMRAPAFTKSHIIVPFAQESTVYLFHIFQCFSWIHFNESVGILQTAACGAVHTIEVVSGKAYHKQEYCGCEINTFSYHNCVIKSEMQVYLLGWTLIFVWAKVVNNTK